MVLVAACGADNTDGITFTTSGVPALFDAKLDDGPWQTYRPNHVYQGNATYNVPTFLSTIDAVFVCENADGTFDAHEIRSTDQKDLGTYCDVTEQREQLVVTIHGVAPQGNVDVFDYDNFINQSDAQFSIQAPLPTVDVLVHDSIHLAVQHDVDTRDGPSEVAIDLASAPPIHVGHYAFDPPDSDEDLYNYSYFDTANSSHALFFYTGGGSYAAPDSSLVMPGDQVSFDLLAWSDRSIRSVGQINPDSTVPIALHWLPRITGSIDPVVTAATLDPFDFDYDSIGVNCNTSTGSEFLSITHDYRDSRLDDLAFTEAVPGWKWTMSPDQRGCGAGVDRTVDGTTYQETDL